MLKKLTEGAIDEYDKSTLERGISLSRNTAICNQASKRISDYQVFVCTKAKSSKR